MKRNISGKLFLVKGDLQRDIRMSEHAHAKAAKECSEWEEGYYKGQVDAFKKALNSVEELETLLAMME